MDAMLQQMTPEQFEERIAWYMVLNEEPPNQTPKMDANDPRTGQYFASLFGVNRGDIR